MMAAMMAAMSASY
jgi:hypothetical protein